MNSTTLASRGRAAGEAVLRVDMELYFQARENLYDPETNPHGTFPLNVAENRLLWPRLRDRIQNIFHEGVIPDWVAGYTSSLGAPEVRQTVAGFLETALTGCSIDPDCLGFSPGSTSVIEMTAFILAEPGDVAVFPAPCYPVYTKDIGNIPGVERYDLITHDALSEISQGPNLSIAHLEQAAAAIQAEGKTFRMLVLTHPDNPTGAVYSREQLLEIAEWCQARKIHLVVNEIYGLSLLDTGHPVIADDYPLQTAFSSFARIMQAQNSDYLHLWYAFSKDFGVSGFRFGLVYSQNRDFIRAYQNLNLSHTVSNVTQWILQGILEDQSFLEAYLAENRRLLTESYAVVVQTLKALDIPYVPARGSLFVWADLGRFLRKDVETAEMDFWRECYETTGILLTPGVGFGHPRRGRFRIVHAYFSPPDLAVAMERFKAFLKKKVHSSRFTV